MAAPESGKGISGRWTVLEHEMFVEGLRRFGRCWRSIAELVPTRSVVQIRTHAQKFFMKLEKTGQEVPTAENRPAGGKALDVEEASRLVRDERAALDAGEAKPKLATLGPAMKGTTPPAAAPGEKKRPLVPRARAATSVSGVRQSNRTPKRKRWALDGEEASGTTHAALPSTGLPGHHSRATSPNDDSSASTVSYSTQPAPGSVSGSAPGVTPEAGGAPAFATGLVAATHGAGLPAGGASLLGGGASATTASAAATMAAAAMVAASAQGARTSGKPKGQAAGKPKGSKARAPGKQQGSSSSSAGRKAPGSAKSGGRKRAAKGSSGRGAQHGRGGKVVDDKPRLQPSPEAVPHEEDSDDEEIARADPHFAFAAAAAAAELSSSLPRPAPSSAASIHTQLNARRPRGGSEATIAFRQAPPLPGMRVSSSSGFSSGAAPPHRGRAQSVAVAGMSAGGRKRTQTVPLAPLALPGSGLGVTNVQMSPGGLLYGLASQSSEFVSGDSPKAAAGGWAVAATAVAGGSGGIAGSHAGQRRSGAGSRGHRHHHHHRHAHDADGVSRHDADEDDGDSSGSEHHPAAFRRGRFPPGLDAPAPAPMDVAATAADMHHLPLGRGRRGSVMRSRRGSRHAMDDDDDDDVHSLVPASSAGMGPASAPAPSVAVANAPKRSRMADAVEARVPPVAVNPGSLSWGTAVADRERWQAAPAV